MIVNRHRHIIKEDQLEYLRSRCPRMKSLIEVVGEVESYYISDPFIALTNGIVYQSISFKAATVIWNRFISMFDSITPESILYRKEEELLSVGLSKAKVRYIINIATAFHNNEINLNFNELSNDEIKTELQKIKGIGPWTSEIFLIFCLYRKDVISYGDIAIRKGIEFLYNLNRPLTKKEFAYYEQLYAPYQTIASFYLWEITLRNMWQEKM